MVLCGNACVDDHARLVISDSLETAFAFVRIPVGKKEVKVLDDSRILKSYVVQGCTGRNSGAKYKCLVIPPLRRKAPEQQEEEERDGAYVYDAMCSRSDSTGGGFNLVQAHQFSNEYKNRIHFACSLMYLFRCGTAQR